MHRWAGRAATAARVLEDPALLAGALAMPALAQGVHPQRRSRQDKMPTPDTDWLSLTQPPSPRNRGRKVVSSEPNGRMG